jgi:hypothetical protein
MAERQCQKVQWVMPAWLLAGRMQLTGNEQQVRRTFPCSLHGRLLVGLSLHAQAGLARFQLQ